MKIHTRRSEWWSEVGHSVRHAHQGLAASGSDKKASWRLGPSMDDVLTIWILFVSYMCFAPCSLSVCTAMASPDDIRGQRGRQPSHVRRRQSQAADNVLTEETSLYRKQRLEITQGVDDLQQEP